MIYEIYFLNHVHHMPFKKNLEFYLKWETTEIIRMI